MTETASRSGENMVRWSRILVTGSDGFVGGHLVPELAGLVRNDGAVVTTTRHGSAVGPHTVLLDLERPDSVTSAIEAVRPDAIVHLAAQSSVGQSSDAATQTWSTNFGGSMVLAEAIATFTPDAVVLFASSAEVYGRTFNYETASEESPLRPASPYARSKAAAEAMLADVLPASCRLIVARSANHSGAGQSPAFVVPGFAAQIAAAERDAAATVRVGNLDSCRDFLPVEDVVRAYRLLLARAPDLPMRSVFNIASGDCRRIGDLLDQLLDLAARRPRVEQDPARMRPSEVIAARLDNTTLRSIGWTPSGSLDAMLAAVLDDQRRQRGADDRRGT